MHACYWLYCNATSHKAIAHILPKRIVHKARIIFLIAVMALFTALSDSYLLRGE